MQDASHSPTPHQAQPLTPTAIINMGEEEQVKKTNRLSARPTKITDQILGLFKRKKSVDVRGDATSP